MVRREAAASFGVAPPLAAPPGEAGYGPYSPVCQPDDGEGRDAPPCRHRCQFTEAVGLDRLDK